MSIYHFFKRRYNTVMNTLYKLIPAEQCSLKELFPEPPMQIDYQLIIAIRWQAIKAILNNSTEIDLYCRVNSLKPEESITRITELYYSLKMNGFNPRCPIPVDLDGNIINGRHRLALCAYLGIESVYVRRIPRHLKPDSSEKLALNYAISASDYQDLEQIYLEIYEAVRRRPTHDNQASCK